MRAKKVIILFFFLFFSLNKNSLAVVKGSETSVSVEPAFTFPASDSDNKILGFAWFKNGFSLEDNTTTCTFDAIYPVSGNIDLNGGTLYLSQDLVFQNVTNLLGLGTIFGDDHSIILCPSISQLPAEKGEFENLEINLSSDLVLTDSVILKGNCKIFGHDYDIILDNGYIIIDSGAQVHFVHLTLEGVNENNFILTDDSSSLIFENVTWKQADHYNFTNGSIQFLNYNDFIGSYSFVYDSNLTSTICDKSKLSFSDGMCLRIGRKISENDADPLYFEDQTSVLRFNGATILVTDFGMQFLHGKVEFDSNSQLETIGTTSAAGIIFGSGSESDDFLIHFNSGASLKFESGMFVYNNYKDNCITAFSDIARLVRYVDSKVYLARNCLFPNMTLKIASGNPQTTLADGVISSYDRTKIMFSSVEYDFLGHQSGAYNFYLDGNEYLYLSRGTFSTPLSVSGSGNKIYGVGNFSGNIILQDSSSDVSLNLNGLVLGDVQLNGGTLTLAGDLILGSDAVFDTHGQVDLVEYNFEMSGLDSLWTGTINWQNTSGAINLNSKVSLSGKWIFDDSCIINGNGNTIDVGQTGQIVVGDGVELTLRNVALHMVSSDDIQCASNNSAIILDNSTWVQDTDITFTLGSLKFVNHVDFIGSYSFIYDTNMTATIAANSTWNITGGIKAYLGKKNENSANPIYMENCNSKMRFDDSSLFVTGNGMSLTRGNIDIDRNVILEIAGTSTSTGLMLGSGAQEDDITAYLSSGCSFNFRSGQLVYNNTVNNGFVALSESGRVIRYVDSKFHIMSDLIFPTMYLKLYSGAPVTTKSDGVSYFYDQSHMSISGAEFDFKGQQASSITLLLAGSDYIYMNKGNLPLGLLVSGVSNQIFGTGNISGPIILQDDSSELILNLSGLILKDITLNGGSIKLSGDLLVGGDYNFVGAGSVSLQNNSISFGDQDTIWTSTINWMCGCGDPDSHDNSFGCPRSIKLHAYTKLSGKWQFDDDCVINGNGNTLEIDDVGQIIVGENVKLIFRDIDLKFDSSNCISLLDNDSKLELDNVSWIQYDHIIFSNGSIEFLNNVDFIGSYSFIYDSSRTSTIATNSTWKITKDMRLYIGRKEAQDYVEPLYMQDETSVLELDSCTFIVTATGMELSNGKLFVNRDVDLSSIGTTTSNGLTFGTGAQGNDVVMCVNAGSCLGFTHGCMVYNNYANNKIVGLSENAMIRRSGVTRYHMLTDLVFPTMQFKIDAGIPITSRASDSIIFSFNRSHLIFENVEFDFKGKQDALGGFSLEGSDYIYLAKGLFEFPIAVSGISNQIFGTGNVSGPITLQDDSSELILNLSGLILNDITLNGGCVKLSGDLAFGGAYNFAGTGTVKLQKNSVSFGDHDSIWTSTTNWTCGCSQDYTGPGCPRSIKLNSHTKLRGKWQFDRDCIINANGNTLEIEETGQLIVGENVKLIFRDVDLKINSANNISLLNDDSKLELDNVSWVQYDHVLFSHGSISFLNNVDFIGSYSFIYDSSRTSTIEKNSTWAISENMKLYIGRKEDDNYVEPLCMQDETSVLKLDSCSLVVTAMGIQFTNGKLFVTRDVDLSSIGTTTSKGLIFGNGAQENDATLCINSGGSASFSGGCLVYNNYANDKFVGLSENAIIRADGTVRYHLNTDSTVQTMQFKIDSYFITISQLNPAIRFMFDRSNVAFDNVNLDFKGRYIGANFYGLEGSDYLYMTKGVFLFPIMVSGTGNQIFGTGDISGPIILQDSSSELILNPNGFILNNITLNGGSIKLGGDLVVAGAYNFAGAGTVKLQKNSISFGDQDSIWTSTINWMCGCANPGSHSEDFGCPRSIRLNSYTKLRGTWQFDDDCIINGNGNTLEIDELGQLIVSENVKLILRDVDLKFNSGNNLSLLNDESKLELSNVFWTQHDNLIFSKGSIAFLDNVDFIGSYSFIYDSSRTSTIATNSTWKITKDMKLYIGRKEAQDYIEPLYMEDETSVLKLDSCSFIVTATGMQLTNGKLFVSRDVDLSSIGTTTSTGLIFGNGAQENDAILCINSGGSASFTGGCVVYNNYAKDKFLGLSENAIMRATGTVRYHLNTDSTLSTMQFKIDSYFITISQLNQDIRFEFERSNVAFNSVNFDLKGRYLGANFYALEGNDYLYMTKGVFLFPMLVSGSGNQILGSGSVNGPVILADSDTELTCDLNGPFWNNISLNGGNLTLMGDMSLGGDYTIEGPGQVRLMRYNVILGVQDSVWTSTIGWHSNGLYPCPYNFPRGIDLNSDVTLSGKWEIQDCCTISGNGHTLDLGDTGQIEVQEGVCLTLRNVILHSTGENNIYCLADSSSITLDNVTWVQDSNVTFTHGSIKFVNEVDFIGSSSFVYDSSQTSTVAGGSCWTVSGGIIVRIGKKEQEGSLEPLYFENSTSICKMDDCNWIITGSGMTLSRGVMSIDGDVAIDIVGTTTSSGFILGTGVQGQDAKFELTSRATLHFASGQFVYNNYGKDGISVSSESATLIRYGGSSAYVNRDWTLPSVIIKAALGFPETVIRDGVKIRYDRTHLTFSESHFEYTGSQSVYGYFVMEGNDYIFIDKGAFAFPVAVLGTGNMIYGAGGFNGLLMLQDSNTELTFAFNGTLGEDVLMNGAKIILGDDLYLTGGTKLVGSGKIDLAGYKLAFGGQDLIWESPYYWEGESSSCIDIRSKFDLRSTWTLSGIFTLNGYGNILDLSNGGDIVIDQGSTLVLRNVKVTGVSGNNIRCLDDSSIITLDNAIWVQDGNYTFTIGKLNIVNEVDFLGSYSFIYDSSQTSSIQLGSSLRISGDMAFRIGKQEVDGSLEPLYFADATSILKLDNCNLIVTGSGMNLKRGTIDVDRDVVVDIVGTTTSNGFTIGTGLESEDAIFHLSSGATLHFASGQLVYNDYTEHGIVTSSENATIVRYGGSSAYVNRDWTIPSLVIKAALGFPETLIKDGVKLRYVNTHLTFSESYFEYTGSQSPLGYFVMEGDDYIFIDKGAFAFPVAVAGTGNMIYGAGGFNGLLMLQDSNTELTFAFNGTLGEDVLMNGAKIILGDDLYLTGGTKLVGSGKIDLDGYKLAFGGQDLIWESPYYWEGESSSCIDIRSKFDLRSTWTLSGIFTLNGYGNILDLSNGGNIVVEDDSNLILRNVKITGISGNNIRCLGDASIITLDDAIWVQDGNYTFTTGALKIKNETKIEGPYEFCYQTKMTSTVLQDSTWRFGLGVTLKYDPLVIASKDLIELYDETACLKFCSASLHSNVTGMNLKKGSVLIKGECIFFSDTQNIDDVTQINEGIMFGSGSQSDDCVLQVGLGSVLSFSEGAFVYNNVLASSLSMENKVSAIKVLNSTECRLNQNFNVGEGILYVSENALLNIASGKNIIGSVFIVE
ncbi:hypothetical protein ACFLYU_01280 [Candidatus Dependentiae bacterium]